MRKQAVSNSWALGDILNTSGSSVWEAKPADKDGVCCHGLFCSVASKTFDMNTGTVIKLKKQKQIYEF